MTVRPCAPSCLNSVMRCQTLDRVGAVQRLVEHEHVGIAHERGGDLRALTHALAEGIDTPVGDVQHRDGAQRVLGRAAIGDAVEIGDVVDELAGGEPARHGFVFGHEGEPAEDVAIRVGDRCRRRAPCPD